MDNWLARPLGEARFFPSVCSKPGLVPWCLLRRCSPSTPGLQLTVLFPYSELVRLGSLPHKPAGSPAPAVGCRRFTPAYECTEPSPSLLVVPQLLQHLPLSSLGCHSSFLSAREASSRLQPSVTSLPHPLLFRGPLTSQLWQTHPLRWKVRGPRCPLLFLQGSRL